MVMYRVTGFFFFFFLSMTSTTLEFKCQCDTWLKTWKMQNYAWTSHVQNPQIKIFHTFSSSYKVPQELWV